MSDFSISRQGVLNILSYFNEPQQLEMIKKLPPAQADLITKIQNGIKATNTDDVYSCGMRNGMRWCLSLIDGKDPLYENCPSAYHEIILCKDCKHFIRDIPCVEGHYDGCDAWTDNGNEIMVAEDDFCSYAERRQDG